MKEKPKNKPRFVLWKSISFMAGTAWKTRKSVLFFCLATAVANVGINLLQLFIAPEIIKKVEQLAPLWDMIWAIIAFSLGLFVLHFLVNNMNTFSPHGRYEVRASIREAIIEKMCLTSFPNASNPDYQNLRKSALATTQSDTCATEQIWIKLTNMLMSIGVLTVHLLLLIRLNIGIALIILFLTIIASSLARHNYDWIYHNREERGKRLNQFEYARDKAESVVLAKEIRILGLKPWLDRILNQTIFNYETFVYRKEKSRLWGNIVDTTIMTVRSAISYGYLIHMALTQGLSAAEFLLYFNTIAGFSKHINDLFMTITDLYTDCLEVSLVREYLSLPELFCFEERECIPKSEKYDFCMEHVTFRYPKSDTAIFNDLNLTIHPGEKLAIVGLNGAGKTTLVKLLCGLYDPDKGHVLLNGIDIKRFDRREYYELFSAVFQDSSILDVTIAETVAQQHVEIDKDRVMHCIEKAGLSKQIEQFSNGIETHIGKEVYPDGVLLSGGQMQRLLLARALYKDGAVLVLDEPTAALDPIAEDDIYRKYNEMTIGKTSVFISHRLASTRFCDRIIFLANGSVLEEGSHEQLLQLDGEYAKLFKVQSQYYQEGRGFADEESWTTWPKGDMEA